LSASRNRDQGDFGQVQPLAQQVDADQHVELAAPEIAEDLDAFQRFDVRMQVADTHAELMVVLREILRHALRQRRHEHALARGDSRPDFSQQVVHLPLHGPDDDRGVHQPGRAG